MTEVKPQPSGLPWYEGVIARHAPGWAARREEARYRREYVNTIRGSISTRLGRPFGKSISYAGGTAAKRFAIGKERDRGRKVFEENAIGRGLLTTETDNIVADGFHLQAKTDSPDFNSEAEEKYEEWCEVADVRGLRCASEHERQIYRSPRRDGDGGVVLLAQGAESRCQYIPGDLICTPDGKWGEQGIIDGVEIDSASRPVAFHILDINEWGKREWTRVAARDFIYMAPVIDDDLGVRGNSCYSQVFEYLDGLDGYVDAVIVAARMACVFGLIFKEEQTQGQRMGLDLVQNSQGREQRALTLENGSIKWVGKTGDVAQVVPQQPMNQTPDFIRAMARLIGVPFDMPLELAMKDMSQVNFASARIGLLGYYRACRSRQAQYRSVYLDRRYQWWISREQKKQSLGIPGSFVTEFPEKFWPHNFVSVGWDYTDPVSEAQGDQLQIDMGTKTEQMVAAERGRDWEEMQEDRAVARMVHRLMELPEVHSTMTRDAIEVSTTPTPTATPPVAGEA
jgi:capsid protein